MSDDDLLARARDVWRASPSLPAQDYVGAQRVARRLRMQRRSSSPRRFWAMAGAAAACMATLAYAGKGPRTERNESASVAVSTSPTRGSRVGGNEPASEQQGAQKPQGVDIALPPQRDREAIALTSPPSDVALVAPMGGPTEATPMPASGALLAPRVSALREGIRSSGSAHPSDFAAPHHPVDSRFGRVHGSAVNSDDASWRAVNDALTEGDTTHAERLLTRLSIGGSDADVRAKAKLGLAQLQASRGQCDRARKLALAIASQSGIETKTVRRALELAARCLP